MDRAFLEQLLNTATVSGNEEAGQELALAFGRTFADTQKTDAMGGAVSIVHPEAGCSLLLTGHMDEIGFRVTHIRDDGMLEVQKAGGVRASLYVGSPMQIIHETVQDNRVIRNKICGVGVVSQELLKKTDIKDSDLIIDIGAENREEAMKVVSVGDTVCADTQVRPLLGNKLSCRALDDKAGAFVILEAAKLAVEKGAACRILAHTSVGEETTGRGAYAAASALQPDCCIVVDVTWASDCPGTRAGDSGNIHVGGGPVLCHSGITNKAMNSALVKIAEEKQIPIQWEVAGGDTYTDGDTMLRTGAGVPVALVSIPLRYMHSSVEVASWKDLEQCIELISEFAVRLREGFDYRSPALRV